MNNYIVKADLYHYFTRHLAQIANFRNSAGLPTSKPIINKTNIYYTS